MTLLSSQGELGEDLAQNVKIGWKHRSNVEQTRHYLTCTADCLVETVLVDDEPMNTLVMEKYLEHGKYKQHTFRSFNNSQDALKFVKAVLNLKCCGGSLKLILTDIEMPGLNGFELAQLLRQECRRTQAKHLKIVAQTTLEKSAIWAQAAFSGFDIVLTKPLTVPELLPIVDQQLFRKPREEEKTGKSLAKRKNCFSN